MDDFNTRPVQDYSDYEEQYPEAPEGNNFTNTLAKSFLQFFVGIGYFLFVVPFALWCKAMERLAVQHDTGALRISGINGLWPLLSYLKRFLFEFLFDALIFIAYPVGILFAIIMFMIGVKDDSFSAGLLLFFCTLIGSYYFPIGVSLCRDFFQLFIILPIRKIVSFFVKPAQQLDLNLTKKN